MDPRSSWLWYAENASSGAYGIPQSLPADKMAAFGANTVTMPPYRSIGVCGTSHKPTAARPKSMATFRTNRLVLIGYEAHKEHTLMNDTIPATGHPLLGAADIRRIAADAGISPTKKFGQNFVIDPGTVRRIVRETG